MKRYVIPCLIIVGVVCVCLSLFAIGAAGVLVYQKSLPETATPTFVIPTRGPTATLAPSSTPRPSVTPGPTITPGGPTLTPTIRPTPTQVKATPSGSSDLPANVITQMDAIEAQVEKMTGWKATSPVQRSLFSPDQLQQRVLSDFLKDYLPEDAKKDALELNLLGLLPANFDLISFYEKLYAEQIAGFYDNKTKEMVVVQGAGFNGPERMTYSHEFAHVLQDQLYDIQNGLNYSDEKCKHESERCAGVQAILEGDASLVESLWFNSYATAQDKKDVQNFYQNYSSPVYDSAPEFMKQDFLFPYQQGKEFIQSIYDKGRFAAVNAVFANPPVSTEQILHPEKYPDDRPVDVKLPDVAQALGAGWQESTSGVIGEWYTYLILAQSDITAARLPDRTAKTAADGWGGDAYAVYSNGSQNALAAAWVWDTQNDASEFANAFKRYGNGRWGQTSSTGTDAIQWQTKDSAILFNMSGSKTQWVIAPDLATAQAALDALK